MALKYCILLFLISLTAQAKGKVRIANSQEPGIALSGDSISDQKLVNELPESGSGTSKDKPFTVYVPIKGSGNSEYFYGDALPDISSSANSYNLKIPFTASEASNTYLYVAVEYAGSFTVLKRYSENVFSIDSLTDSFEIDIYTLCGSDGTLATYCSGLLPTSDPIKQLPVNYYFFTSETDISLLTTVSASTYPDGIYIKVNYSNKIYSKSSNFLTLSSLGVGDKSLTISYSYSGETITHSKDVLVFSHLAATPNVSETYGQNVTDGDLLNSNKASQENNGIRESGLIIVFDLENDTSYTFSVAIIDKFGFLTVLSNQETAIPIEIETFIQKNACFLLSAGFKEKHFVLDTYRWIRDSVLLKTTWGRHFVNFYYEKAPYYSYYVYHSKVLGFLVRFLAYMFLAILIATSFFLLLLFVYLASKIKRRIEF